MKKIILFLIAINFILTSCIPDEHPVAPHKSNADVISGLVDMGGQTYRDQVYYSLESNTAVASNPYTDWDLGFSCDTIIIKLNSARGMRVVNTHKIKFDEVTQADTMGIQPEMWQYDNPAYRTDSTAIGIWWEEIKPNEAISKQEVYIIDRGTTDRGRHTGYRKFQIIGFENNTYYIKFANLDGSNPQEIEIHQNYTKNYVQLSMEDSAKVLELEPDYNRWDLLFTHYTELLYTSEGNAQWYGVTGVLLNPKFVYAILDTSKSFDEITYQDVADLTLSDRLNSIGHEWKWFDLGKGVYSVLPERVYIIKSVSGYFYKLHFVAFYNEQGIKGYPKFEFIRL